MTKIASSPTSTDETKAVAPARWSDYLALLKPRVMSLVVFTALTGYVCADRPNSVFLAIVSIFCIAIGAGASGALNMWYDSDIDAQMRRTRGRPIPAGRVQRADAAGLGVVLSILSVLLMAMAAGRLAAGLLLFTIVFYVLVYTMWLKRSTPQNIVIGGLAGALPPVIGWAAATGQAPLNAWLLCLIIFLWTPPHFWALSLYTSADYAKAGVPMMPVVKGARSTRNQIMAYSVVLVLAALLPALRLPQASGAPHAPYVVFTPVAAPLGGPIYLGVAAVGGLIFLLLAFRLWRSHAGEAPAEAAGAASGGDLYKPAAGQLAARNLFAFSILYLTLLFAALLAEHLFKALHA
ncbi:MAG: protoheme farnesyl transferase [Caulobacteraceae bacterium]|nr:protoheme farnesyl transferase [Caulobacteraceae bacterium]